MLIPVQDADVAGARLVRGLRDGTRERRVLNVHRDHEHVLVRRDVGSHPNGEPGESLGGGLAVHGGMVRQATARAQSP